MTTQHVETTILDAAGQPHRYWGQTLPTMEGGNLLLEVADVAEGPLAALIRGLYGETPPAELMDKEVSGATVGKLMNSIDMRGVCSRALARGGLGLAMRMLSGIHRETTMLNGAKGAAEVGTLAGFNDVYSANYAELIRAVVWVARVNYLPFSPGSSSGGSAP